MAGPTTIGSLTGASASGHRPISLTKWLLLLGTGTVLLLAYIGLQRDIRLKRYSLEQAAKYAGILSEKLGESRTLPLNLDIVIPLESAQLFRMNWLSRDEARWLRQSSSLVVVGRSENPLRRVLTPDGWMVVTFHQGQFKGEWYSNAELDEAIANQKNEIARIQDQSAKSVDP